MRYTLDLFDNGVLRDHVISLLATEDGFEFIYCDRSIIVRTDRARRPHTFILFIYGLLRLDRRGWGYAQPLKQPINKDIVDNVIKAGRAIPDQFRDCIFLHPIDNTPLFKMGSVIFSSRTAHGRGTKIFTIEPVDDALPMDVERQITTWKELQNMVGEKWKARVRSTEKKRQTRLLKGEAGQNKNTSDKRKTLQPADENMEADFPLEPDDDDEPPQEPQASQPPRTQTTQTTQPAAQSSLPTAAADEVNAKRRLKASHLMDFVATRRIGEVVAKISLPPRGRKNEYEIVRYLIDAGIGGIG